MIPARIISISDKVMAEWPPEPVIREYFKGHENDPKPVLDLLENAYWVDYYEWKKSRTIAEVENVSKTYLYNKKGEFWAFDEKDRTIGHGFLTLNQSCFIEPTSEGKCKIIKI